MKYIYCVRQAVWGADRKDYFYFATRDEAHEYYETYDYCDKPVRCHVEDEKAKELLRQPHPGDECF